MRLKSVAAKGFMRFKDGVRVEFPPRQVTFIAGENGSGKTSILDAISVCLYGTTFRTSGQARSGFMNMRDLINHDSTRARIQVEFESHGHNYLVTRDIHSRGSQGELFEDGESKAMGEGVYRYVKNVALGLDWEGFRNSSIVLQGEMSSLTNLLPSQRKEAFEKLFGLDRYLRYDATAKNRADSTSSSIEKLEEVNLALRPDVEKIPETEGQIKTISTENDKLITRKRNLGEDLRKKKSLKSKLEKTHNKYLVLNEKLSSVQDDIGGLEEEINRNTEKLNKLLELKKSLPELRKKYKRLLSLESRLDKLKPLKTKFDQLQESLTELNTSLRENSGQLKSGRQDLRETEREINSLKRLIPTQEEIQQAENNLAEAETRRNSVREAISRIKGEISTLEETIPKIKKRMTEVKGRDTCPLCLQKIENPAEIVAHYRTEIKNIEGDMRQKKSTKKMLQSRLRPARESLEKAKGRKQELEKRSRNVGALGRAERSLGKLSPKVKALAEKVEELKGKISGMRQEKKSLGFNEKRYNQLDSCASKLRRSEVSETYTTAKTRLKEIPALSKLIRKQTKQKQSLLNAKSRLNSRIASFGDIESKYTNAKTVVDTVTEQLSQAGIELASTKADLRNAKKLLNDQKQKKRKVRSNEKLARTLGEQISLLETLRTIFKHVPENVLRRLRPFIEREGTDVITDLSDGEMTSINIEEETLNVSATIRGRIRPIHYFSGGQKTRINMALRVAISRILSKLPQTEEHTFAVMKTLFIDEGDFGDLDESGIREAISVIRNLTKEFDVVVLVSHVEAIRDIFHGYTLETIKTGDFESSLREVKGPEYAPEVIQYA